MSIIDLRIFNRKQNICCTQQKIIFKGGFKWSKDSHNNDEYYWQDSATYARSEMTRKEPLLGSICFTLWNSSNKKNSGDSKNDKRWSMAYYLKRKYCVQQRYVCLWASVSSRMEKKVSPLFCYLLCPRLKSLRSLFPTLWVLIYSSVQSKVNFIGKQK